MLHCCLFLLYRSRRKPIQYCLQTCWHERGICWNTQSLVLFSGQSVGPDLWAYVQHAELLVAWSCFSVRQCQSIQFSPGMRTNAKIFLSQIDFLFSDQLVACIRCLMSVCSRKNRCTMGKYVWHKPDGLIFVFMEIVKKYISWLWKVASFHLCHPLTCNALKMKIFGTNFITFMLGQKKWIFFFTNSCFL